MAGYAAAKRNFLPMAKRAARIIGIDDAHMRALADNLAQDGLPLVTLGAQNADLIYLANAFQDGSENISLADYPALPGAHNAKTRRRFCCRSKYGAVAKTNLGSFESFGACRIGCKLLLTIKPLNSSMTESNQC